MYYFFSSVFVFESKILNLTFSSHHLADEDKLKNKNIPSRFDYSGFHVIFYFSDFDLCFCFCFCFFRVDIRFDSTKIATGHPAIELC